MRKSHKLNKYYEPNVCNNLLTINFSIWFFCLESKKVWLLQFWSCAKSATHLITMNDTWLKRFIGSLSIDKLNSSFLLDPYKFYSLTVSVHSAWDHPQKWAIQLNCPVGGSTGQLHLVLLRGGPLGPRGVPRGDSWLGEDRHKHGIAYMIPRLYWW